MQQSIKEQIAALQDASFAGFQRGLLPTVDPQTIIGVRTPQLRAMAKRLYGSDEAQAFLAALPHDLFEENQLHAFLIEQEKDFDRCLLLVNSFLPFVDNWATCDQLSPKALGREPEKLLAHITGWLASDQTYTIRFGVNMLMRWFLDTRFETKYLDWAAAIRSEEYYVKMGVAWFFATAPTKQYGAALPYIERRTLDAWTHNKAIQKATESRCIAPERKAYLRTLRIGR